ncbi:MAG: HDIG domain-containing metalloprotein [bacterium]
MKQWLSKFRSQRLKERYKDGGRKPLRIDIGWWNQPSISLLIGVFLWGAASMLLYTGIDDKAGTFKLTVANIGDEVFLLIITVIAAMMLRVLAPKIFKSNTHLLLLAMSALFTIIPGSILIHLTDHGPVFTHTSAEMLIPFALAPLLSGILLGGGAAIVVGLWTTLVCFVVGNGSAPLLVAGLIATAASARWLKKIRRRTQVIRIGFLIGIFQIACLGVLFERIPTHALQASSLIGASVAGGLMAGLLVLLLLPVCESLFGLTSTVSLLELSDLAHPLLQRLAFEAPGTYHHSLMVANLAQAAADEIGANSVLARVGAYFHDIGKITKSDYYTENIRTGQNPHDDLAPSMSALLVMSHIKEGITLAMLYKLPQAVIDIIQQHQGTGLVVYFHHKAGRQAQAESMASPNKARAVVDESSYRYPGPKPISREAAIIMLADSVEASSRSLEKPTASGITELVDRIVDARVEDNQLDDCEMTLEELSRVKRAFVFCLSNMLHSRIAYPKQEEKKGC